MPARAARKARSGPASAKSAVGRPSSGKPAAKRRCPICGKPATTAAHPFCSQRCRDVDLNRWLSGSYVIPGKENDEEDAE
jgi:hypothetical protein